MRVESLVLDVIIVLLNEISKFKVHSDNEDISINNSSTTRRGLH